MARGGPFTEAEAAWAAGFIEGEGNIYIGNASTWQFIYMYAMQNELGVACLYQLQRLFGGTVFGRKKTGFKANHPMWTWVLRSQSGVIRCASAIRPHLHHPVRIAKFDLAIQALGAHGVKQFRLWTPEEDAYLGLHYKHGNAEQMGIRLGRTTHAVRRRTSMLGLATHKPSHHQ